MVHFNNRGYSLSGVIIAIGILATVVAMSSQVVTNLQRSAKGIEQDMAFNDIIQDIKFLTQDASRCTKYLGTQLIDQSLRIEDTDLKILIETNKSYRGWKIKDLKITDITPLPNPRTGKLQLIGIRAGKNHGVPEKYRDFLISVDTDLTDEKTIISCYTQGEDGSGGGSDATPITPPSNPLLCGNGSSYNEPGLQGGGVIQTTPTRTLCERYGSGTCTGSDVQCGAGERRILTYGQSTPSTSCSEYACVK